MKVEILLIFSQFNESLEWRYCGALKDSQEEFSFSYFLVLGTAKNLS